MALQVTEDGQPKHQLGQSKQARTLRRRRATRRGTIHLAVKRPTRRSAGMTPLIGPERRSRTLARRISPIRRIVASLNRKRDALPAFRVVTPKGEHRSPVLDTENSAPGGICLNALTNPENPTEVLAR